MCRTYIDTDEGARPAHPHQLHSQHLRSWAIQSLVYQGLLDWVVADSMIAYLSAGIALVAYGRGWCPLPIGILNIANGCQHVYAGFALQTYILPELGS